MPLLRCGLLALLLPVCCFAPGFFFIRKTRWTPLEKLCGGVGLSLILLFLASWAIYCSGTGGMAYGAVSTICAAMALASSRDIVRLVRAPTVRRTLGAFAFLLAWTGLLVATVRNYSGALWSGDWMEHFQRSLFFLHYFPARTVIFPFYQLPARPPMMNVLAAFFMAQTADRFEVFQAVFVFLNLLLFLPGALIMPRLAPGARRRPWLLALLFAASPVVMENATYTWTKAGAAFFVAMAVAFLLAGWRKRDAVRIVAAFLWLSAGVLVHYSAAPYAVILTVCYLAFVLPARRRKFRELGAIAATCGLLLGSWFAWSIATYGVKTTFASNSSVTYAQSYRGNPVVKSARNLYDTIVPVAIRRRDLLRAFDQPSSMGKLRDYAFVFYQLNLCFGMGLLGGPLVLCLIWRALRNRRAARVRAFWILLILGGVLLGIGAVGERDRLGVAHLTMLALQVLGIALLAASVTGRRRTLAALVIAGSLVDLSLGVLLQAGVERLNPASLSESARGNWTLKHPGAVADDSVNWGGWFGRHGGEVTFLGDHMPGPH